MHSDLLKRRVSSHKEVTHITIERIIVVGAIMVFSKTSTLTGLCLYIDRIGYKKCLKEYYLCCIMAC